jgi:hypothetical protein
VIFYTSKILRIYGLYLLNLEILGFYRGNGGLPEGFRYEVHYKISQFYRRQNSVGVWLEVRRWFFYRRHHRRNTSVGFTFVGDSSFRRYISRKNKKIIYRRFYRRNVRAKKKDSRLKSTDGFSFRRWNWNYWRKISVVTSVGECMKYRRNISVCKFVGTGGSYC